MNHINTILAICILPSAVASFSLSMTSNQRIAVVTGASRGIGRGIALELGGAGYKVYALGRSSRSRKIPIDFQRNVADNIDLTVESAAEEVTKRGGQGFPIPCDLSKDGEIEIALEKIYNDEKRIDLLVCSAYTTPVETSLRGEFWTQGMQMWDAVNGVGLRQVYAACQAVAPKMIETAKTYGDEKSSPPLICLGKKNLIFHLHTCHITRN
jgi:dehydrogenase/reductase SDR family member 1